MAENGDDPKPGPRLYLLAFELAERWRVTRRTLQRNRKAKVGPPFLKLGGRIVYPIADVEDFERKARHEPDDADEE